MVDGYFVHYFAPSGLQPVPKNVVFVIDVSGSMAGTKLAQTIESMHTVLDDLRPEDTFNVLVFSDFVTRWNDEGMVSADASNIQAAKTFVAQLTDQGCKHHINPYQYFTAAVRAAIQKKKIRTF